MNKGERLNSFDNTNLTKRLSNPSTEHDKKPYENKADLNAIRYQLYKKGVDVFNQNVNMEDLDKLDMTNAINKRIFRNYSKKDLLWLLNNIAYQSNSVDVDKSNIRSTMV